jgi:putative copper resistance protein D
MNALLGIARAVHFGSAVLLFGELVFAVAVAAPIRQAEGAPAGADEHYRRLCMVGLWSIVAGLVSWVVWLGCEAALMSGAVLPKAVSGNTMQLVFETRFGKLWLVRFALAAVLGASLWSASRSRKGAHDRRQHLLVSLALAGVYLASLAWAGHAAAGENAEREVQVSNDVVHLLAAGAWLGALPALASMLHSASPVTAAQAARRFSVLGIASVSALLVTGIVNAWYLVGDWPALFGTDYGRLLLVKLALFASMLSLAAVNRFALTPRLARGSFQDAARLRRNAILETAAGVGVIAIVGALGITIPAAHQAPVWPFSFGLDLQPAYPTSYAASPVHYTTTAIARGGELYAQNCASCHGQLGHGDGPAGGSLALKPANLAEHGASHRPGDLYWWIAHGIAGTSMPGFAAKLSDTDIWTVVQFLRALSDAEAAESMNGNTQPPRAVRAPDFTFELMPRVQDSLAQQRAKHTTLLVLYTLPQSDTRLRALSGALPAYAARGTRIISIPMHPGPDTAAPRERGDSILASVAPEVAVAYAMFARTSGDESLRSASDHVEFLIDDQGYLRRRWVGLPSGPEARTAEVLQQIDALAQEPVRASAPEQHTHMH